jgi:lysophospholipase L1-like esterase
MRATILALAFLLLTATTALASPLRVMPFGDSTTMGQTWEDGDELLSTADWIASWVGYRLPLRNLLTADGYSIDFVGRQSNGCATFADCQHEGHGGYSIPSLSAEVEPAIVANHPDVMLVMVGTAGLVTGGDDGSNAGSHLTTLLQTIYTLDPAIAVVLAEIPPQGIAPGDSLVAGFNVNMPGIVATQRAAGQQIVLVNPGLVAGDLVDGVHPAPGGYAKIATAMEGGLKQLALGVCAPRPSALVTTTPLGAGQIAVKVRVQGYGNHMAGFGFSETANTTIADSTLEYHASTVVGVNFTIVASSSAPTRTAWTMTDACGTEPGVVELGANAY